MQADLSDEIKALIAAHFGIDADKLRPQTEIASLGIDSLALIEFMFQMEDKFNIRMADSRAPLATVGDVVAEIENGVRARQASPAT